MKRMGGCIVSKNLIAAKRTLDKAFKDMGVEEYLEDPTITELILNTDKKIFIKKLGVGFVDTGLTSTPGKVRNILNILASLNEVSIDGNTPSISSELPLSKNRVEGLIPPIVDFPKLNIRKKIPVTKTLTSYLEDGFISEDIQEKLVSFVRGKKNILVVGGTDTGKTTFVNALLSVMDTLDERLVIIEEVEELQTKALNVDRIKVIPGIFSARQALKSCMRLSPERIIFGEIRGEEAFDLINGFNSGHSGGVTTIHANDCLGGLKKLEMYNQMACSKPLSEMIALTVDIVITLKMKNAVRYLDSIAEVKGYDSLKGEYELEFLVKL